MESELKFIVKNQLRNLFSFLTVLKPSSANVCVKRNLSSMKMFLCRLGGILLGVRAYTMEVIAHLGGDYHIKLHVRNRADNFVWSLVAVYGAAQDEYKADFLRELVNLAKDNPYPILIGGDFNLLRFRHEKSKGRFDDH
jgi:hypothetical protein